MNNLHKTELIHSQQLWESTEAVEPATTGRIHWRNSARMHQALAYRTTTEVETIYTHRQNTTFATTWPRNKTQDAS